MRKKALLIGVNDYSFLGPLRYAEADAEGVAESLQRNYGFAESEIILMTSKKPGILRPLKAFVESQLKYILERLPEIWTFCSLVFGDMVVSRQTGPVDIYAFRTVVKRIFGTRL